MRLIDWYLLRCVVASTWRGLLWFGGLLVTVAVITAARKISDESLPLANMVELVWLQIPRVFLFALPMATLFGTLEAFTELSGNGELTALMACGTSLRRLMRTPLLWGLTLAIVSFCVQDFLVPRAENTKNRVLAQSIAASLANGPLRYSDPPLGHGPIKRMVNADAFDPKTNTLTRPVVRLYDSDQKIMLQIVAESGVWDQETNKWRFSHGQATIFPKQKTTKKGEKVRAASSISNEFDVLERNDAPEPGVLSGAKSLRQHLEHGDYEVISFAQLVEYRRQMLQRGPETGQTRPEYAALLSSVTYGINDKIATPLVCIVLVLAGVALGLRPQRAAGSGFAVGASLMVLLFYYSLWSWTSSVGLNGSAHPALLAYCGSFAILLVGSFLLWRKRL